jgi:hypothetical protein
MSQTREVTRMRDKILTPATGSCHLKKMASKIKGIAIIVPMNVQTKLRLRQDDMYHILTPVTTI